MIRCETIAQVRGHCATLRRSGPSARLGFVPTMGALHDGHLSLVGRARRDCELVAVSIFVNPTQFGPGEDYEQYPRCMAEDGAKCEAAGVDVLFAPPAREVYPQPGLTTVHVRQVGEGLCARQRPGHFDGVALVVAKLLNIVQPDRAYFGQKDAQQLAVIDRMVRDLNMPVDIVGCPTVRESDGLAMSSRNAYLTAAQRRQAAVLYGSLQAISAAIRGGELRCAALAQQAREMLERAGPCEIDYVELVEPQTMAPISRAQGRVLAALAVRIGQCRLIDNLIIDAGSGND